MKIVRLAIVRLSPTPRTPPAGFHISRGAVAVQISPIAGESDKSSLRVVVKASISIPPPALDAECFALIPDQERSQCEDAISAASDLLAITTRSRRTVCSATAPLALIPENQADLDLLAQTKAIRAHAVHSLSMFYPQIEFSTAIDALNGRWDGAALLAEAYSHTTMSGRFREFVRLFELAFRCAFTQVDRKLAQTLLPAMGYTRQEIQKWQALRHPFTHADGRVSNELAFDPDARNIVQRMEQAAMDILFNKAEWGEWSSSRRDTWQPHAISTSETGGLVVRQGSKNVSLEQLMIDEFGRFPRDLGAQHTNLPADWFTRYVPEGVNQAETPSP